MRPIYNNHDRKNKELPAGKAILHKIGVDQCAPASMVDHSDCRGDLPPILLDSELLVDFGWFVKLWPLCSVLVDTVLWGHSTGARKDAV